MTMDGTQWAIDPFDKCAEVLSGFEPDRTLRALVRSMLPDSAVSRIAFVFDASPDLPSVRADGSQMREVFRALLQRSYRAALTHRLPYTTIMVETRMFREAIQICITDDTPVDPLSAFSDETGNGCLTLTQCAEVVHDHGGEMRAWTPRCSGTTAILVELPIA